MLPAQAGVILVKVKKPTLTLHAPRAGGGDPLWRREWPGS